MTTDDDVDARIHTQEFDSRCPYCRKPMQMLTHFEHVDPIPDRRHDPKRGDVSICWLCGEVGTFDASLKLVKATPADWRRWRREDPKSARMIEIMVREVKTRLRRS